MDEKEIENMEKTDPMIDKDLDRQDEMKAEDSAESLMDGPNLIDPGEDTNKSQDEGKVYDL